ncbi:hypothetical protein MTO96_039817 [Rhipicephalus appendiculatus]
MPGRAGHRRTGVFPRRNTQVVEENVDVLTECKELSSIASRDIASPGTVAECVKAQSISLIAQCITGMTTLRKLKLSVDDAGIVDAEIEDVFDKARWELVQALSANKYIRKLSIEGLCVGDTEIETLADTLQ